MRLRTYWSVAVLYLVLIVATLVGLRSLPDAFLSWVLFAVIAAGLVVEGAVMAINTTRKDRWNPTILVLVIMRLGLGGYFFWASGLAYFDADRTWRETQDELVYLVRDVAMVVVLAELFVIPYRVRPDVDLTDLMTPKTREGGDA